MKKAKHRRAPVRRKPLRSARIGRMLNRAPQGDDARMTPRRQRARAAMWQMMAKIAGASLGAGSGLQIAALQAARTLTPEDESTFNSIVLSLEPDQQAAFRAAAERMGGPKIAAIFAHHLGPHE